MCTGAVSVDETLTFTVPNGLGVQSIQRQISSAADLTCTVTETDTGGALLVGYQTDGGSTDSTAPTITLNATRPVAGVTVVNDPTREVAGESVTRDILPFTGSPLEIALKSAMTVLATGLVLGLVSWRRRRKAVELN